MWQRPFADMPSWLMLNNFPDTTLGLVIFPSHLFKGQSYEYPSWSPTVLVAWASNHGTMRMTREHKCDWPDSCRIQTGSPNPGNFPICAFFRAKRAIWREDKVVCTTLGHGFPTYPIESALESIFLAPKEITVLGEEWTCDYRHHAKHPNLSQKLQGKYAGW